MEQVSFLMLLLVAIMVAFPSPMSEVKSAYLDAVRLPPAEAAFVRYLTTYAAEKPVDDVPVLKFWSNSISLRKRLAAPVQVTPTLYRVDLREFNWKAETWEELAKTDVYFCTPWLGEDVVKLAALTGSSGPVLRADWFIAKTSIEPFYSKFLGLGKTVAEVQKLLGVHEADVKEHTLNAQGAVLQSIVALHNRQLERYPSIMGYWWQSRDTNANVAKRNVLENLEQITPDGGEYIFSLPNGLQGYYLSNGAGEQVAAVPEEIAVDSVTRFQSKTVTNARSCVVCHDNGLRPFADVISRMIRTSPATLIDPDKQRAIKLEELYLSDLQGKLAVDSANYAAAVKATNGLETHANAIAFERVVHWYIEGRVDAKTAARELGVEDFREVAKKSADQNVIAIAAGEPVARDAWETAFAGAAVLALKVEAKP